MVSISLFYDYGHSYICHSYLVELLVFSNAVECIYGLGYAVYRISLT